MKNLTEVQKIILSNYPTMTFKELCSLVGLSEPIMKGQLAVLSKFVGLPKKEVEKTNIVDLMRENNEGKTRARQFIFNAILQSNLFVGNVLSLPCVDWFIELAILEDISNQFRIIGVELENSIYRRSGLTLFRNPILSKNCSLINGTMSEQIYKGTENEYAHLILDYCGGFSRFANEINFAMTNKLVQVGGTISMTFSSRAFGNYGRSILNRYGIEKCKDKNKTAFELFLNGINTLSDAEYELETSFGYRDSETMVLFIVKRVK